MYLIDESLAQSVVSPWVGGELCGHNQAMGLSDAPSVRGNLTSPPVCSHTAPDTAFFFKLHLLIVVGAYT